MARIEFREAVVPREFREKDYYVVEYDFKGACGGKSNPRYQTFYRKFEETFGQKIGKYRSTDSVLIMPKLEDAQKVAELVRECDGEAHINKCVRMD